MDLLTSYYSLFLSAKANNAGDPGKPLNDNFIAIDEALWNLRTNYRDAYPSTQDAPIGSLLFNKISDELYLRVSNGLVLLGSATASGWTGALPTAEQLLVILEGRITADQLITDLASPIAQLPNNLILIAAAEASAVQAAYDAEQAKLDAIQARNEAQGFKVDAYDYSIATTTQSQLASGYAQTASTKASEAASSAGAAGESATASESSRVAASTAAQNAIDAQTAAVEAKDTAFTWKTDAEAAAGAAHTDSITASIGAVDASGYANAALNHSNSALSYSDQAGEYAIAAEMASGVATTAAGQAETFFLRVAEASGGIQSAMDTTSINAENASGYANSAHLSSVSASGYAQEAYDNAQLVASYLSGASVSGYIGLEQQVRADADTALADSISQISTTVGDHTATIETHQQSLDGIGLTYTVKMDNNGNAAGFGLTSVLASGGAASSEFAILADKFKIAGTGETPSTAHQVFTVNTATGTVGINARVVVGSADDGTGGIASDKLATYKVEIVSSNGIYLRKTSTPTEVLSVLSAIVHKGEILMTDIPADRYKWTRQSYPPNNTSDDVWNNAHFGGSKTVDLTSEDVNIRATFTCEILEN